MSHSDQQRNIPISQLRLDRLDAKAIHRDQARALKLGGTYLYAFTAWKLAQWYAERRMRAAR